MNRYMDKQGDYAVQVPGESRGQHEALKRSEQEDECAPREDHCLGSPLRGPGAKLRHDDV